MKLKVQAVAFFRSNELEGARTDGRWKELGGITKQGFELHKCSENVPMIKFIK